MQDVAAFIQQTLTEELNPAYMQVADDSHRHNVPDGAQSHFTVTVVTEAFDGLRLIARHRRVNELLAPALAGPVHALALHTFTPQEWAKRQGQVAQTPDCLGGSKR